jgi:hypothetical protein
MDGFLGNAVEVLGHNIVSEQDGVRIVNCARVELVELLGGEALVVSRSSPCARARQPPPAGMRPSFLMSTWTRSPGCSRS